MFGLRQRCCLSTRQSDLCWFCLWDSVWVQFSSAGDAHHSGSKGYQGPGVPAGNRNCWEDRGGELWHSRKWYLWEEKHWLLSAPLAPGTPSSAQRLPQQLSQTPACIFQQQITASTSAPETAGPEAKCPTLKTSILKDNFVFYSRKITFSWISGHHQLM